MGMRRVHWELDIAYFIKKQLIISSIIRALTTKEQRGIAKKNYALFLKKTYESTTEFTASDYEPDLTCPSVRKNNLSFIDTLEKPYVKESTDLTKEKLCDDEHI